MLRILFVLLLAISTTVQAEHITDKLLVGLYAEPKAGLQPTKVLPSGTPLEILDKKDAYSQVRLGDGKEGWVKTVYISSEKPARAMLLELQAQTGTLKNKLLQAEKELKAAKGGTSSTSQSEDLERLKQELNQTEEKLTLSRDALKTEQQETRRLMQMLKQSNAKASENSAAEIKALRNKLSTNEKDLKATKHEYQLLQDLMKKTDQNASKKIAGLEQALATTKKKFEDLKATGGANPQLIKQNQVLRQRFNQVAKILSAPVPKVDAKNIETGSSFSLWIPSIILLMIAGFIGGVVFNNIRMRKRQGSYRV